MVLKGPIASGCYVSFMFITAPIQLSFLKHVPNDVWKQCNAPPCFDFFLVWNFSHLFHIWLTLTPEWTSACGPVGGLGWPLVWAAWLYCNKMESIQMNEFTEHLCTHPQASPNTFCFLFFCVEYKRRSLLMDLYSARLQITVLKENSVISIMLSLFLNPCHVTHSSHDSTV